MTKKKTIAQQMAEKTFMELDLNPKTGKPLNSSISSYSPPKSSLNPPFRIKALEKTKRQSPGGKAYQYSAVYRNAVLLRLLIKKFTNKLNPKKHHRLISQLDFAVRSVVANIREGYVRPKSSDYSTFLGFSQGSLEEVRGDIEDVKDDGLIISKPSSSLKSIGINLKPPNTPPKTSYNHLKELKKIVNEELRAHWRKNW